MVLGIGYRVLVKRKEELIDILRKSGLGEKEYHYFLNFANKIVTISKICHGVYKIKEQNDLVPDVYWTDDLFVSVVGKEVDYLSERIRLFCTYQCIFSNSDNCEDCYLNLDDKIVEERIGIHLIKEKQKGNSK